MTFERKAELFPQTVMVVGIDTAVRILDPRYYGNRPDQRDRSLLKIRENGCRFLVGGRIDSLGQYRHLEEIEIPTAFRDLFEGLSEGEFRVDLSSTMLRHL